MMRKIILMGIALFNIYNNSLSMMNSLQSLCGGEQGAVNGSIHSPT